MKKTNTTWTIPEISNIDILVAYRAKIFYRLTLAGLPLILPFTIYHFTQQRFLPGIFSGLVLLIFVIDAIAMHKGKNPPIPPAIVIFPVLIGIGFTFESLGFIAAVWVYPAMILFFFVLRRATANILCFIAAFTVTLLAIHYEQPNEVTVRIFATTMLTIIFINLILNVINSLQESLQKAAIIDELTGAYNRRYFNNCLMNASEHLKRYQTSSSVLILDIDYFKSINDKYGHSTGDLVLKDLVTVLSDSLRKVDMIFRVGGEEFTILLPETDREHAMEVAEKLRTTVSDYPFLENHTITVSIGAGEMKPDEDLDILLNRCDRALYQAKNQGRNQVCLAH